MSDLMISRWAEAVRLCLERSQLGPLARHLARLPEGDRSILLEGIGSEALSAEVKAVLRRREEQLALV